MDIHCFSVNPFYENTYLFWTDPEQAVLIDPGFYTPVEEQQFLIFLENHGLTLSELILTHAHVDHIFGLSFIQKNFGLKPRLHASEMAIYKSANTVSGMYGLRQFDYPEPGAHLSEGPGQTFGGIKFDVFFTPGHSPGSLSFYAPDHGVLFSGDVLFEGSIGRTDLPGGDYDTLIRSIRTQLLPLPGQTRVYSGHGGVTTIGQERVTNPFLN